MAKTKKEKKSFLDKIKESPINYFSDLLMCAMVVLWIVDAIYESVVASVVTFSSIAISIQNGENYFDTSMWSSIGSNISAPLLGGGCVYFLKCACQHGIANMKGKQAHMDFPKVDLEDFEKEPVMFEDDPEADSAEV